MIVFEELVYQEALRRKMTVPPERCNSAEADFRKQFGTPRSISSFSTRSFKARSSRCGERSGAPC